MRIEAPDPKANSNSADEAMTDAYRRRGRRGPGLELLESRSLLSNLDFRFFAVEESTHQSSDALNWASDVEEISGPVSKPEETPTFAESIETASRSLVEPTTTNESFGMEDDEIAVGISNSFITAEHLPDGALHFTIDSSALKNAVDLAQFTHGNGQGGWPNFMPNSLQGGSWNLQSQTSPVTASVYMEGGWLVVEFFVTYQEMPTMGGAYDSPTGPSNSPASGRPPHSAEKPVAIVLDPSGEADLTGAPAPVDRTGISSDISDITVISRWFSEAGAEDLRSNEPLEIAKGTFGGINVGEAPNSAARGAALRFGEDLDGISPNSAPFPGSSAVGQLTIEGLESRSSPTGLGQDTLGSQTGVSESSATQASASADSQTRPTAEITETVKGIKIRGVFTAPVGSPHSRTTVDLAIIHFEKPMPVRVQLPFIVDSQYDLSQPVSDVSADGEASAEAIDAALSCSDSEASGLGIVDWPTTGALAIAAACVGYALGRQRRASTVFDRDGTSSEPFTAVFDEVQLRRLTRRLGFDTCGDHQPALSSLRPVRINMAGGRTARRLSFLSLSCGR